MENNLIKGFCTRDATKKFFKKKNIKKSFLKEIDNGIMISSIGIGTYKGELDKTADLKWEEAIMKAISFGFNVFDTAAKYRNQKSEIIIGKCINKTVNKHHLSRDNFFISTKGGLIGFPEGIESKKDFLYSKLIKELGINEKEIYNQEFCIDPKFIKDQIEQSRKRLQLNTIDCYYLHNPETLFLFKNFEEAYKKFFQIFDVLEEAIDDKKINSYGIASWNGLRRKSTNKYFLDINRLKNIANTVGGTNNGFKYLQIPLSVGMPFAFKYGYLDQMTNLGLNIFTSASAYEGKLKELNNLSNLFNISGVKDSPNEISPLPISFPKSDNSFVQLIDLLNDFKKQEITLFELLEKISPDLDVYQSAINLIRSIPNVKSALVGMQEKLFVEKNSILVNRKLLTDSEVEYYKKLFY